jgi:hypothetical protein
MEFFADTERADLYAAAIESVETLVVPVLTVYEVVKKLAREAGDETASAALALMQRGRLVDIDLELALQAARPRSEPLVVAQVAPLPRRQRAQHDAADAHALEAQHLQADQLAHAADLALAAFAQHDAQLLLVLPAHPRRAQRPAVELEAVAQPCQRFIGHRARAHGLHAHQVLLLHVRLVADQPLGDAPVLRQHQQPGGVDVEPPAACAARRR